MEMPQALVQQPATHIWFAPEIEASVHTYSYSPGQLDSLPHTHDEYNIIFCRQPGIKFHLRGKIWNLDRGDVLVINPNEKHHSSYGRSEGQSAGLTLHVTNRQMKKLISRMALPVDVERQGLRFTEQVHAPELTSLIEELTTELAFPASGYELAAESLVIQLLVKLLRNVLTPVVDRVEKPIQRQLPSWQMVRTLEYMNRCGKSGFSLQELCSDIGSCASRFIDLFKNSCGNLAPQAFYNTLLANRASRLLAATDWPVKEISFVLGFQNESHFCRAFRRSTGLTPGQFRSESRDAPVRKCSDTSLLLERQ